MTEYIFRPAPKAQKESVIKSNAKLTKEQVLSIREEGQEGKSSQMDIAKKYGVAYSTISDIVNYRRFENW